MDYPYCEKVNLPMESLLHDMPKNLENFELTNGVILELTTCNIYIVIASHLSRKSSYKRVIDPGQVLR
jgi:hypothetical protein